MLNDRHVFVTARNMPYRRGLQTAMVKYSSAYFMKDMGVPVLRKHIQGGSVFLTVLENKRVKTYETNTLYNGPLIKNAYDGINHFTDTKYSINLQFLALLQRHALATDHVMVLDTYYGRTVQLLLTMFRPKQIHVPNPANEINLDLCDSAQWHAMTALEFLRDWGQNRPMHYWLDYCCTFAGSHMQTLPKLDLTVLFLRGDLPRTGGVLAMTFSMRGTNAAALIETVERFVQKRATTYKYKIKRAAPPLVYNRMIFFSFVTG
jgi:hypothetical protein